MLHSSSLVSFHEAILPRARGHFIWFLHKNHWANGFIWILKNIKKPGVEICFPSFLCLPSHSSSGTWPILLWWVADSLMRALWGWMEGWLHIPMGHCWSGFSCGWYMLGHWSCVHIDAVHTSWAHGGQHRIGCWGGTLYGPPSGIIRTLGWCTGVTREANNSVVRLPGFESWLIHLLAVWFWGRNFASLSPSINKA